MDIDIDKIKKFEQTFGEFSVGVGNYSFISYIFLNPISVKINDCLVHYTEHVNASKSIELLKERVKWELERCLKYSSSGCIVICDEIGINLSCPAYVSSDISQLDWKDNKIIKNYFCKTDARFYCLNETKSVRKIVRIRQNATLFNVQGYHNDSGKNYIFGDNIYNQYVEDVQNRHSYPINIIDFVINLDMGTPVNYKGKDFPHSMIGSIIIMSIEDKMRFLKHVNLRKFSNIPDLINNKEEDQRTLSYVSYKYYMNTPNSFYEHECWELDNGAKNSVKDYTNYIRFNDYTPLIVVYTFTFPNQFLIQALKTKLDNQERVSNIYKRLQLEAKEREQKQREDANRKQQEEEKLRDFNQRNYHNRDRRIKFRDRHYYSDTRKLLGTTGLINNFFPKFDAEYWAGIKAPLMGKTPQQLLDEWDRKGKESSEAGTILHQRIDDYYHHKVVQTDAKDYTLFKQFADAYKLNPYRSEWAIFDEDSGIVGVVDMLDYSNGEYILYDWKRSEKVVEGGQPITKNKFDEYGLKPIENVPNTDYWHYALQLSFYRYILEKNYGIRIKESRLVVLHPTQNLPVVLTTPYMIDEVNKIIEVMKM